MNFTGKNLIMIRRGIDYALGEIHNQIATCPDVQMYDDEIEALEAEQVRFNSLLARIDRAIDKEEAR